MTPLRRIAVLAAALSLAAPAGALAQDPPVDEGGELSTTPPGGGESERRATETRADEGELARTGAEPGLVALLGAGFVLTGLGLRVRVRQPLA